MSAKKGKIKVLLVEDDELAQIAAKFYMEKLQCDPDIAETGKEAIQFAKRRHYDIIFMDLGILDMDGFTITETIRHLHNTNSKVPIIVLTAHLDKSFEKRAKVVGCDDYLVKPLNLEKLDEILQRYTINKK
jgi:CheY-like chemotaxis protein